MSLRRPDKFLPATPTLSGSRLGSLAALAGASLMSATGLAETAQPNILWILAEDFGQHLGFYGTPEVFSPNLDSLAERGMRFDRFFTTSPICSPSRSSMATGMYQTTIDAHHHRSHRNNGQQLPEGVHILSDHLRDLGYFTARVVNLPDEWGFDGFPKDDWNFAYTGEPWDSTEWSDLKDNQPFYAQINFNETHRIFKGPERANPDNVVIPPYYPDHPLVREDWARYLDSASALDEKIGYVLRDLEAQGLADNTIVIFLGDNGQAHIRGKQFLYDSGLLVPFVIYIPPGIAAPKGYEPGSVSTQLLEGIDLTATTIALAGGTKPVLMQGRVFLGDQMEPARTYVFGARDRADETLHRMRTVRDHRYRYIRNYTTDRPLFFDNSYKANRYPVWNLMKELDKEGKLNAIQKTLVAPFLPSEELYDTWKDPHETINLVNSEDPNDQEALIRLRAALDTWILQTGDQGEDDDYSLAYAMELQEARRAEEAAERKADHDAD